MEKTCEVVELSSQKDYRRLLLEDKDLQSGAAAGIKAAAAAAAQQQLQQQQQTPSPPGASPPASPALPRAAAPSPSRSSLPALQLPCTFLHPLGAPTDAPLEAAWQLLVKEAAGATVSTSEPPASIAMAAAGAAAGGPTTIPVMFGRSLEVPAAAGELLCV
jgi:hypothetical protein